MALAASLLPGFKYEIVAGALEGEIITIADNTPFPDCQDIVNGGKAHKNREPHNCTDPEGLARKITCLDPEGKEFYILPRLLSNSPVAMSTPSPDPIFIPSMPAVPQSMQDDAAVLTTPAEIQAAVIAPGALVQAPITDPMDSRLDHLRPSKTKVKQYLSREMANGMTDIDFLLTFTNDSYRAENDGRPANIMLKGDTQSGKTMLVEVLAVKWAEAMGLPKPMPIFTISGSSGVTDYDLYGQTTSFTNPATGQEHLVWLPGMADLAAQCGGILYLDEVNAMGERVTSSLHPLTDHRHHFINRNKAVYRNGQIMPDVVSANIDLWIIGTYNEGYRGMGDMNEAFINRFRHIRWGYDSSVELKLIKSAALRLLGDALRTAREKNTIRTPIGTAALQKVERDVEAFGPVLGLNVLTGMFKANEAGIVESIIEDRSIIVLLNEEERQRKIENKTRQADPSDPNSFG